MKGLLFCLLLLLSPTADALALATPERDDDVPPPLLALKVPEALKAALAAERFLELSADEQFDLVGADFRAAQQMFDARMLDEYSGQHVAVLRRQVVGTWQAAPRRSRLGSR